MDHEQLARAFSTHDFERVFDHLDDGVEWTVRGHETIVGREAVIAACRTSAAGMAGVTTTWPRLVSAAGPDVAFVDAIGRYDDPREGASTVSSCDIYELRGGRIVRITSYLVELPTGDAAPGPG